MNYSGFVTAAAQLGLTSLLIKPERGITSPLLPDGETYLEDIVAQAVIEERHVDQLEVTEHPIEVGASVSDHAFKLPPEVIIRMAWSNSPNNQNSLINAAVGAAAAANSVARGVIGGGAFIGGIQSVVSGYGSDQLQRIYNNLLILQESRAIFHLYTGKRRYSNMICRTISTETDNTLANTLLVVMECRQVILVNTQIRKIKAASSEQALASPTNRGTIQATGVNP
jgi:hypothetical protein